MSVSMQMVLRFIFQSAMTKTDYAFRPIPNLCMNGLAEIRCPSILPNVRFNNRGSWPTSYKIGDNLLNHVNEIKYLDVIMQSNLKFNSHVTNKVNSAKKFLECINYALNDAPQPTKLLTQISLCRQMQYEILQMHPQYKRLKQCKTRQLSFFKNTKGRDGLTKGQTTFRLEK